MKKLLFVICCFSFLQGCGQKKEQSNINQNLHITADNIAEEIAKEVKHYPNEPVYIISYDMYYTHFELYVDDMPAFKQFNHSLGGTADDINHVLFKKGKHRHTVKYKMYPVGKTEDGDVYDTFPDFTYLKLRLKSYDLQNEKDRKGKQYMEHRTPYTMVNITPYDKGERFVAAGKDYYEGSFEIETDIPFQLDVPFANAQDLRKMDRKELEKKLLIATKKVWNVYQSQDYDNIAKLEYLSFKNMVASTYEDKESIVESWKAFMEAYSSPTFEMKPIENYRLEFFADGKLAALMLETKDKKLKRNTVLWGTFDNGTSAIFCDRYFYIPEGETEFKVY